jgi:hypothetical protein
VAERGYRLWPQWLAYAFALWSAKGRVMRDGAMVMGVVATRVVFPLIISCLWRPSQCWPCSRLMRRQIERRNSLVER